MSCSFFVQEKARKALMMKMSMHLVNQLSGELNVLEMKPIIDVYDNNLTDVDNTFMDAHDEKLNTLVKKLKENREVKLKELNWRHENLVSFL